MRAARTLLLLWCASALAAAQTPESRRSVLVADPEPLTEIKTIEIATDSKPRLLMVRGALPGADARRATLQLDGAEPAALGAFADVPGRFAAALPLVGDAPSAASRSAVHTLKLRPGTGAREPAIIERIEVIPAARVRCSLRDQETKLAIKGVVQVTAVDGGAPPLCGPFGSAPRDGAAWISVDGGAEVWAPRGSHVTYVARGSPFRAALRFRRRLDLADVVATIFLPPDQRPEGARILESLDAAKRLTPALTAKDEALDVGARVADWDVVAAETVLAAPDAFVASLLAHPEKRLVVTNETGPSAIPTAIRPFVTLRLADGALLHSNAPLPLLEDLRREGGRVKAWIKLRCPEDARLDAAYVKHGRFEFRLPASGPTTLALDVEAPSGTPVAIVVKGSGFESAPPMERPLAVRVFRAP
jgi:hypothetical protein